MFQNWHRRSLEYQPPNEGPAKKRRTGRHPRLYKVENDIWGLVSEFAGTTESNMLALSSAHMNNALSMNMASQAVRHRNKIVVNDAPRLHQWMESYPHVPFRVAHIDIQGWSQPCDGDKYSLRDMVDFLSSHRTLNTLELRRVDGDGGDDCDYYDRNGDVKRLARLGTSTTLHTLSLILEDDSWNISDKGAEYLARLGKSTTLHTLHLGLSGKFISSKGAQHLTRLGASTKLHTLTLDLSDTDAGLDGGLAGLRESTTLRTLTLGLAKNNINDDDAKHLAVLGTSTTLKTLTLNLCENDVGPDGAQALVESLRESTTLHTLTLGLAKNRIGDGGAKALATLKTSRLNTLTLDLRENNIGPDGAQALAGLRQSTTLSTMTLGLADNSIGDGGAKALATLKTSTL